MGESNFILAKRDSFQAGICVDLFTFLLIFICKHVINYFFIPLRQTEAIAQENFVPAVRKRDPALPRWNFSHGIEGYNLWRVYSTIGILCKRDRISSRDNRVTEIIDRVHRVKMNMLEMKEPNKTRINDEGDKIKFIIFFWCNFLNLIASSGKPPCVLDHVSLDKLKALDTFFTFCLLDWVFWVHRALSL